MAGSTELTSSINLGNPVAFTSTAVAGTAIEMTAATQDGYLPRPKQDPRPRQPEIIPHQRACPVASHRDDLRREERPTNEWFDSLMSAPYG